METVATVTPTCGVACGAHGDVLPAASRHEAGHDTGLTAPPTA